MKRKIDTSTKREKKEYQEIIEMVKRASKKAKQIIERNRKAERELFAAFKVG